MSVRHLFLVAALTCFVGISGCGGTSTALSTPTIVSIVPSPAVRGSTLTINGANLNGGSTYASFVSTTGTSSAQAIATGGNTSFVTVTAPNSVPAGTYSVYVQTIDSTGELSTASNSVTLTLS